MALYRFLFAPVLLAVAVLTTGPRRAAPPPAARSGAADHAVAASVGPAHAPTRAVRLRSPPATAP